MALLTFAERGSAKMLKKRIITMSVTLALLVIVAGSSGVAADMLGLAITSQAHACGSVGGGGGC
jgi:hypothetical protein